jgi:hypothetical protein
MEPEKAPWSSRPRRDRSRSPSAPPRDPYDYIRRTRIKADEWDTYWDNFPTSAADGGPSAAAFNNNTVHKNNNNVMAAAAAADGAITKNGARPPERAAVTPPSGRPKETKEQTAGAVVVGGGSSSKPSPAGMLAMEDESMEPEVKPIGVARTEGEEAGRTKSASKLSAKGSEFADLVAMKSHLPSAEFR